MVTEETKSTQWCDKYEPHTLDEYIGHEDLVKSFKQYVAVHHIPNLTLGGPPGTGKTALVKCFAHDLGYLEWDLENPGKWYPAQAGQFQFLDASNERGIDMVRTTLKGISEDPTLGGEVRLICLDEGDNVTGDAQAAMRGVIQNSSSNSRFILTGNYPEEFIAAINSRCPLKTVPPLTRNDLATMIKRIQVFEKFTITDEAVEFLITVANGDMRLMINKLQDAAITSAMNITKKDIGSTVADIETAKKIIEAALTDFNKSREVLITIYQSTKNPGDILSKLYDATYVVPIVQDAQRNEILQLKLRTRMADVDYYLSQKGINYIVQLDALLSYIRLLPYISVKCPKVN